MKYANVQLRLGKFYNFTKIPLAVMWQRNYWGKILPKNRKKVVEKCGN